MNNNENSPRTLKGDVEAVGNWLRGKVEDGRDYFARNRRTLGAVAASLVVAVPVVGEVLDESAVRAEGHQTVVAPTLTEAMYTVDTAPNVLREEALSLVATHQPDYLPDGQFLIPKELSSGDKPFSPFDQSVWEQGGPTFEDGALNLRDSSTEFGTGMDPSTGEQQSLS